MHRIDNWGHWAQRPPNVAVVATRIGRAHRFSVLGGQHREYGDVRRHAGHASYPRGRVLFARAECCVRRVVFRRRLAHSSLELARCEGGAGAGTGEELFKTTIYAHHHSRCTHRYSSDRWNGGCSARLSHSSPACAGYHLAMSNDTVLCIGCLRASDLGAAPAVFAMDRIGLVRIRLRTAVREIVPQLHHTFGEPVDGRLR